jgi:uncharacterized membrane protein HdeD (DUF308 family)
MKTQLLTGIVSLAIAAVLLLLGLVKISCPIWSGTLSAYPAGFFALLGIVLIFRSLKKLAQWATRIGPTAWRQRL